RHVLFLFTLDVFFICHSSFSSFFFLFFFFNAPSTTYIYTLSLHVALPISTVQQLVRGLSLLLQSVISLQFGDCLSYELVHLTRYDDDQLLFYVSSSMYQQFVYS